MIFEGSKEEEKRIFLTLAEDELTCCVPELDCDIPVVHPNCFHLIMTIGDHGDDHGDDPLLLSPLNIRSNRWHLNRT